MSLRAFLISGSVGLEAKKVSFAFVSSLRKSFLLGASVRAARISIAFMAAIATFLAPWTSSRFILLAAV
jgi:hypothetical protein